MTVFEKLQHAKALVEELQNKSAALDCKVDDVQDSVTNFKYAFKSLEEDVTALESAGSELLALDKEVKIELKQHSYDSQCKFDDLLSLVESKKDEVKVIKEKASPCGGVGWKRVEYRDFRKDQCYGNGILPLQSESHLCAAHSMLSHDCVKVSIFIEDDMEYNSVCGRIKAFQYGTPGGFNPDPLINSSYLTGISLTHGNPATHIWSFVIGQSQLGLSNDTSTCPCDGGPPSPSFVGEDYFCEAPKTTVESTSSSETFTLSTRNPLWDGQGCIADNTCCSRKDHPYFIKHLANTTTDNITLRLCIQNYATSENILLEIVELYVKFTE